MKLTTILENAAKAMFEKESGECWDTVPAGEKVCFRNELSRALHFLMDGGLKVDQNEDNVIVNPHDTIAEETRFITEIASELHIQLDLETTPAVERAEELYYETKERVGQRYM